MKEVRSGSLAETAAALMSALPPKGTSLSAIVLSALCQEETLVPLHPPQRIGVATSQRCQRDHVEFGGVTDETYSPQIPACGCGRRRAAGGVAPCVGAGLSVAPDHHDRAVPAGRLHRRGGAHLGRAYAASAEPAGHHREYWWRRWQHWGR